ncbi:MAG: hypothetical protein MUF33_06135, partial [Candidatus Nanopelagicales bacterium]|nr:hypothetical protein [Candidatus Nanopelagicales bacterium]
MRGVTRAAAVIAAVSLVPLTSGPSVAGSALGTSASTVARAKSSGGSLRVVAEGVPQGRVAKITVASKTYRKKLPSAGRLRNLPPGTYRVWATPIVTDGGTSAVADLPMRVKVRTKKRAVLRLRYTWNPRSDVYPPGPASELEVTKTATDSIGLRWRNGQAPDLQAVAIRRKVGREAPQSLDEGKPVAVQGIATQTTDTDVRSHTVYSYSVFMLDTAGNASRPVSATARTLAVAVDVTAGNSHSCNLLVDSGAAATTDPEATLDLVECWGANTFGQLGNGTNTDGDVPALVDLDDVVQVEAGGDHTCAIQADADLWCWGRNDFGQLGQGDRQDTNVPVPVDLPAVA